jgi:hypothetical protein
MTLARRVEFLETVAELQKDLATIVRIIEDPETVGEILGSVAGGVEVLGDLAADAAKRQKALGTD